MKTTRLKSSGDVPGVEAPRLEPVCEADAQQDRPRAEAALTGEKHVLEMIAGGDPLPSILAALCRVVEEVCRGSLCSILLLDAKGDRL